MEGTPLSPILFDKLLGGSGGSVTPASIVTATGQMTSQQAADTLGNLGGEPQKFVVTVTDDGQGGYTADKTFAQISEAYQSGSTIIIIFQHYAAIAVYSEVTNIFAVTYFIERARDEVFRVIIAITSNGIVVPRQQQLQLASNIEEIADDAPTITPEANTIYLCDTLTSLTIDDPIITSSYSIVFTSGSTPTSTTIPATILGLENFAAEANTMYEINVLDNRAVVGSWAVTA